MTAKYQAIYEDLLAGILSGATPPGTRLPGGRELAELYHVSYVTAGNAVRKLAESGYVETRPRTGIVVKTPPSEEKRAEELIGMVMPISGDLFQNFFAAAVAEGGRRDLKLCAVGDGAIAPGRSISGRRSGIAGIDCGRYAGLIIQGTRDFPFAALPEEPECVVTFVLQYDGEKRNPAANFIAPDYCRAGFMGVEYLLSRGIDKLCIISYEPQDELTRRMYGSALGTYEQEFFDGVAAGAEAGKFNLAECGAIFRLGGEPEPGAVRRVEEYCRDARCGVLALSDSRFLPLYDKWRERLGRDIFAVGMFDTHWSRNLAPGISSIAVNERRIAELSVKSIAEKWRGHVEKVQPELIIRNT